MIDAFLHSDDDQVDDYDYIPDPDFIASQVNTLVGLAESRLREAIYQDESRNSTSDKSAKTHLDQEVEGLTRCGYAGIASRTKIQHLMNGIRVLDPLHVQTPMLLLPYGLNLMLLCIFMRPPSLL